MIRIAAYQKNGEHRIYVISTGGTIASTRSDNGLTPTLSGEELLERVPQVYDIVGGKEHVTITDFLRLDSTDILYTDRVRLAKEIFKARQSGYDGVVILHGTDQMANTAANLSFLYPFKDFPVVSTGAMRPIGEPGSDAPSHITGAIVAAASGRLIGDFVYFNNHLIRGVRAVKTGREKVIFESPHYSLIARVDSPPNVRPHIEFTKNGRYAQDTFETRVRGWIEKLGQELFDYPQEINGKVGLIELYEDFSADAINRQAKQLQGVIIKSWGVGGIPNTPQGRALSNRIMQWCEEGKVVVVGSRVPFFKTDLTQYEVGMRALKAGAISAEDMNADAALTKLRWCFGLATNGKKADPEVIKRLMLYNFADEINPTVPAHLRISDEEVEGILRKALKNRDRIAADYERRLLGSDPIDVHTRRRAKVP